MGYFSNSSEHMDYADRHCARCVHATKDLPCPVMAAHETFNYEECNNADSILHLLIPRVGASNLHCMMFIDHGLISNLGLERYVYDQNIVIKATATAIGETTREA